MTVDAALVQIVCVTHTFWRYPRCGKRWASRSLRSYVPLLEVVGQLVVSDCIFSIPLPFVPWRLRLDSQLFCVTTHQNIASSIKEKSPIKACVRAPCLNSKEHVRCLPPSVASSLSVVPRPRFRLQTKKTIAPKPRIHITTSHS